MKRALLFGLLGVSLVVGVDGLTPREVMERVGEPLHRSGTVWFSSRSSCDSHFHLRLVKFGHEIVTTSHAEFSVD